MTCDAAHRLFKAADDQLAALFDYIASQASPTIAGRFVDTIIDQCEVLSSFPNRGTSRADLREGLRTIGLPRGVLIAYALELNSVVILGVFYGGQDFGTILRDAP